jgi:hypothetical protein
MKTVVMKALLLSQQGIGIVMCYTAAGLLSKLIRKAMRFTIRDLFWLTLVVVLLLVYIKLRSLI